MPPSNAKALLDDCFAHDRDRLRHDEALAILRARMSAIASVESVTLERAAGRILASDIATPRNIPGYDNSAVDGYAFAHGAGGQGREDEVVRLPVTARIAAGAPDVAPLAPGTAARIFTGAPVPQGADTIVMQEDCVLDKTGDPAIVAIPSGLKKGANLRRAGEDIAAGETLVGARTRLRPQEIAALASAGIAEIDVYARLRIGLVSSGDEIKRPDGKLDAGEVFDSNHFLLRALLEPLGVDIVDLGILPDMADATQAAMRQAASSCDAVITTGGASRGDEDHLVTALQTLGTRHLWQLAVKPGRPMSFGQIGGTAVFGLPGNPVAAFVCFLLYVRPALIVMGGGMWCEPQRFAVAAGFSIPRKKTGRREFWRGWLETGEDGEPVARKFERDGSGLITGLRQASGLIEVDEDTTRVSPGDRLRFIPFSEFGIL